MTATPLSLPAAARARGAIRSADTDDAHLGRLRWAVRAVLTLGVTASIAANVLHARPNLISQIIAAWPPLALLLTVELISRVPADRRWLAAARLIAAAIIAGIAAWVSYWHMAGVAARYGETSAAASYLLPISVDGLVVVASISLVEIAGRIRTADSHPQPATMPVQPPQTGSDQPGTHPLAGDPVAASPPEAATASQPPPFTPPAADVGVAIDLASGDHDGDVPPGPGGAAAGQRPAPPPGHRDDGQRPQSGNADPVGAGVGPVEPLLSAPARAGDARRPVAGDVRLGPGGPSTPPATPPPSAGGPSDPDADIPQRPTAAAGPESGQPATAAPPSPDEEPVPAQPGADATDRDAGEGSGAQDGEGDDAAVPADTAAAVAYWHSRDPSLHPADIATRIGRSERTVRRYWPPAASRTVNGHDASGLADQLRAS